MVLRFKSKYTICVCALERSCLLPMVFLYDYLYCTYFVQYCDIDQESIIHILVGPLRIFEVFGGHQN